MTVALSPIDRHRAYSTREAAAHLGVSDKAVRTLAHLGEFGDGGAWRVTTPGGRIHAIRIAGWAIEAYRRRHTL